MAARTRHARTGAFVSAFPLDSRFGLDRGFEVYASMDNDLLTETNALGHVTTYTYPDGRVQTRQDRTGL
jgi:YD repeat-containing protein